MRKVLSKLPTLALAGLMTACASNPNYRPQPLTYYPAPADQAKATRYSSPFAHIAKSHKSLATLASPNATMEVRWILTPPSEYVRIPERRDCEVTVRDEFASVEQVYTCNRIKNSGKDYYFYLNTPDGKEVRINFTEIPGGFVKGGTWEQGLLGLNFLDPTRTPVEVVWRSHEPVRGYR